jgi:hypothetical protein
MAVFGLFSGAFGWLLIHLLPPVLLLLPSLCPSHRARRREMRGISFAMGAKGLDMVALGVMTIAQTYFVLPCFCGDAEVSKRGDWGLMECWELGPVFLSRT